jgi:hypothetical protein
MSDVAAAQHLACIRCGYDLRGLADGTACPECGLAVHRTTAAVVGGAALADLPPRWVATVARGATVVSIAYLLPLAWIPLNSMRLLDKPWYARLLVSLLILSVHAAGALLITVREPGRRAAVGERIAAWPLRVCSLAPILAGVLLAYMVLHGGARRAETTMVASQATLIACPALTMLRLQQLTRRLGRPRVAEYGAIAGCGLSGAAAAAVGFAVLSAWRAYREWAVMTTAGCAIAGAVFYLWCTWMLMMIARSLRAAAKQARAAWVEADRAR